ncbi:MAG: TRAP transporter substrate-binding protein DctP [Bdellovibrionales bacterium]|nr:TRAP transporter substrate-binding protein DctP [Bdellovibrionales bacterium]
MKRRSFLKSTAIFAAGAATSLPKGALAAGKKFRWRLALGVPKTLPIWGPGIERFATNVEALTDKGLRIRVYGAGELIPALETFDAVKSEKIEMGHSAAYYWQGKLPAAPFFTAVPFGGTIFETLSWLQGGGGQDLYDEMLAPHGVLALACGGTPSQMAGWFNRPINTFEDLKGIKIRIPGFASKVYQLAGATPVLVPGGEVFTSLSTGVIDAAEWVGPYHDYILGLHKAAKYYYGPGWQEQGPLLELMINKKSWESLPPEYQIAIKTAANDTTLWMMNEFNAKNTEYFRKIADEGKVKIARLPASVLEKLKAISSQVLEEVANADPMAKKVHDSLSKFQKDYRAALGAATI